MKHETFKKIGTNAELTAGSLVVYDFTEEANYNGNLPHNAFTLTNLSTSCKLFVFLDDFSNQNKPDFVIFPSQQVSVNHEEGVTFRTLAIKNTNVSVALGVNELKYRISTVKEGGF